MWKRATAGGRSARYEAAHLRESTSVHQAGARHNRSAGVVDDLVACAAAGSSPARTARSTGLSPKTSFSDLFGGEAKQISGTVLGVWKKLPDGNWKGFRAMGM